MSLYSNINAYEQISSFYPHWYLDVYEMQEIIRIEALVATNMQKAIDLILDNHFIDTLDENKASELETYLNISNQSDRSIEERRAIIKSYFLGRGKLSLSQIIAIVEALSGGTCTGCFEAGDSFNNHYIKLRIEQCDIKYMLIDIISTLSARIPAHLWVELSYTPKNIKFHCRTIFGSRTSVIIPVSSYGQWNDSTSVPVNFSCVAKQAMNLSVNVNLDHNIIFGGNLLSEPSETISGGNLQSDLSDTVCGGSFK